MNVAFDGSIFYVAAFPLFEGQDFSTKSKRIDAAQWYIENISETDFDADAADATGTDEDTVLAIVASLSTEAAARQAGLQPAL